MTAAAPWRCSTARLDKEEAIESLGADAVIPERLFGRIRHYRRMATRYEKTERGVYGERPYASRLTFYARLS